MCHTKDFLLHLLVLLVLPYFVTAQAPRFGPAPSFCVARGTQKVLLTDTCANLHGTTHMIDIAGMRGEAEHVQIVVDAGYVNEHTATFSLTLNSLTHQSGGSGFGATIPTSAFRYSVVGHVNCRATTRYTPSGGGWHPDPLFPVTQPVVVGSNVTNSFFVRVDIPRDTPPGVYTGKWTARYGSASFDVPVTVTAWQLQLPEPADMYKSFGEIWSFTTNEFTGPNTTNATTIKYLDLMSDHLVPPDSLYKSAPYTDLGMYDYLNGTGKFLLNLADISNLDGTYDRTCSKAYTQDYIDTTISMLEPTVTALKNSGILDTKEAYVYGFDEQPQSCEANVRALFGAIKSKWPFITTAAVLNWAGGLPVDLPVDLWILQYESPVNHSAWQAWKAAGKRRFWYHCIEPSGSAFLNTFIERPWIQGRLLYWLGAQEELDGWLYYATDLWNPYPGKEIHPIQLFPGSTLTNYDPGNYIWSPRTDIFANGDGQFIYPGPDGPIGTARLANIRDAVEDVALMQAVLKTQNGTMATKGISRLVRGPTDHTDDPNLLETTRRWIAAALDV